MNKNRLTRKDKLNNRSVFNKMPRPYPLYFIDSYYKTLENEFPD